MNLWADIQVLIADDDGRSRKEIGAKFVEAGYVVIAEAADGLEAAEKTYLLLPDIVLMDDDMPTIDGFGAAGLIHDMCP